MDINKIISLFGWQGRQNMTERDIDQANPKFDEFDKVAFKDDEAIVLNNSVIEDVFNPAQGATGYHAVNAYKKIVYGSLTGDKLRRLEFYRDMSAFPEVSDALDEIAESCINEDENGQIVNLHFAPSSRDLTEDQQKKLTKEFEEFISLFDLEDNGFEHFRYFFIDGQMTWENIVSDEDKSAGIIGINHIPNECYEYLLDIKGKHHGIIINAKLITDENKPDSSYDIKSTSGYNNNASQFSGVKFRDIYHRRNQENDVIPMPMTQITHVNTGIFSNDRTIVFPLLERARKAYRQLSLLEDAIIIYRLVRAPERLVFNVDVGKMPAHKAEELVFKLMQRYQSKRVFNESTGDVANDYDPHQMLESYWFPKPSDGAGTTVESLASGANLGELEDLNYFMRKLYIALKVPFARYAEPDQNFERGESITYDEYRFSKYIIRIQKQFARGLMDSFETHLKLRGLWDTFKLNSRMLNIRFTPPSEFDLYVSQRQFEIKVTNYDLMATHEEFSKELAMERFLGMTEQEIDDNNARIEKERLFLAQIDRKIENIADHGTPDEVIEGVDEETGGQKDFRW